MTGRSMWRWVAAALLAAASVAAASEPPEHSFLWRVRSETATVYVLGSVHYMKPESYPLAAPIEAAFERSQVVAFEVDLDALNDAGLRLLGLGTLRDGQTLRDVVSPATYDLAVDRLQQLGLGVEGFVSMRPWLLAMTLTAFELTRSGYSPADGIDQHLFERAGAAAKRRLALETVDDQIGLFENLTAAEDEAFLRHTLDELDTVIPQIEELMGYWRAGEIAPVERLLTDAFEEYPALFRRLVTDRNDAWLPQIVELLAGRDEAMVVVGALHLVGTDGLIAGLEKAGYSVEQL